ncbi:Adenylyltransferase and sulfurtransferase uba4 [Escovopsis weberi]|uniref:Adenylyltransferase and sulfurtransferase uba4 n=1 Tax=Escovopsis weberi TaxID=150374 RepID=A0A0M8N4X5_ESCWE|nr:Adenylyltransferase and sulfurtransferase uba4 [Escovopsis weberi]
MDRAALEREIARREAELAHLRARLAAVEGPADGAGEQHETKAAGEHDPKSEAEADWKWPLEKHHYERYSRQIIVPNFGLQGQRRINAARVLLVGAGGLGCPAAAYLAGAGVGLVGLVDGDHVEVSNLHRQVAHATGRVGMSKVESAIAYLRGLNPTITYRAHATHLDARNAEDIVAQYDLVLDCTDHPAARYLVSDACVLLGKPLISASALQTSGQLIVLNSPPGAGPCYRCVFPRPPPPESVVGCGEGGILGPVVGVMGVLQALEALKLIARGGLEAMEAQQPQTEPRAAGGTSKDPGPRASMLLLSGTADTMFRTVRVRGRRDDCLACAGGLTLDALRAGSLDYAQFCGVSRPVALLRPDERVSVHEYRALAAAAAAAAGDDRGTPPVLVDVRDKEHFDVCHVEGAINVPMGRFTSHREGGGDLLPADVPPDAPVYLICRVGNDSQIAARKLKDMGLDRDGARFIGDVEGGIKAWRDSIDPSLPFI